MKNNWYWVLFLIHLLMPVYLKAQSQKETAALVRPRLPSQLSQDKGRIVISTLEEELSTRFNLIVPSAVDKALKQAQLSLTKEECTEENCLLKMQEILSVNLIFTFGILKDEKTTLLTLQLLEGPKKIVKNEVCNAPCKIKSLMKGVNLLVQKLLAERYKGPKFFTQADPGLSINPSQIEIEEGGGVGVIKVSLLAPPSGKLKVGVSQSSKALLVLEPEELLFSKTNSDLEQEIQVYIPKKSKGDRSREVILTFKVTETDDINYSFVSPVTTRVKILKIKVQDELTLISQSPGLLSNFFLNDPNRGVLKLISMPPGAIVSVNEKRLFDKNGKAAITPAKIRLRRGKNFIGLKLRGFKEERFSYNGNLPLGTRLVRLRPLTSTSSLKINVPPSYSSGEIHINGKKIFSYKGDIQILRKLNLPHGVYRIQVFSSDKVSELKKINLKSGEKYELSFHNFNQHQSFRKLSLNLLGVTEIYIGPHVEILFSSSETFPLKHVVWNIPGFTLGFRWSSHVFEFQNTQGSGVTENFTASESGTDYYIENVKIQRFSLAYGYRVLNRIQVNIGLSNTTLNFISKNKNFKYSYPAAFSGLEGDIQFSFFRFDASSRFNTQGQSTLMAGMGFMF